MTSVDLKETDLLNHVAGFEACCQQYHEHLYLIAGSFAARLLRELVS